jgi:O-antigen/teichoic acid export membrane protein
LLSLGWVVLGYFSIFDFGLGRATTKFISESLGKGEDGQVHELFWTATTAQIAFGAVGSLLFLALTPMLVEQVLKIPSELIEEAKATFYILSISVPVVLASSSARGILEATQRFDLVNIVKTPISALTYILPLAGALLGFGLPAIVSMILLMRITTFFVFIYMSYRVLPQLKRNYSFSYILFRRLFKYGGWITVSSAVGPVLMYIDRFAIGALLTISAVSYYTVPFELICRVLIIPSSMFMTLFPAFSAIGLENKFDLFRLYNKSIKYILLTTVPLLLFIFVLGDYILQLWLGLEFVLQSGLVLKVMLIGTILGLIAPVSNTLLQGIGRPDVLPKMYLISLFLFLPLLYFAIKNFGIVGAAAIASLRSLTETLVLYGISMKFIKMPYTSLVENGLARSIVVLAIFSALLWSTSALILFPMNAVLMISELIGLAFATWFYLLDVADRNLLLSILSKRLYKSC